MRKYVCVSSTPVFSQKVSLHIFLQFSHSRNSLSQNITLLMFFYFTSPDNKKAQNNIMK